MHSDPTTDRCWLPDARGEPLCVREFGTRPCDECPTPTARRPDPAGAQNPPTDPPSTLDEAAHSVWLHGNWRGLTYQMTTEQRTAFADAVDRVHTRLNADDPDLSASPVDRWWRDDESAPADPPSVAVEPPAALGAGADIPEAHSGAEGLILGRALEDSQGDIWREAPAALDQWVIPRHGDSMSRVEIQSSPYGPVREVLLVDPSAGPVLEAALAWREFDRVYAVQDTAGPLGTLAAAADAATSGPPTANLAAASRGLAMSGPAYCVQTTDNDMQAFAELPECEACGGCGKQVPPDFYGDQPDEAAPDDVEIAHVDGESPTDAVRRQLLANAIRARAAHAAEAAAEPAPAVDLHSGPENVSGSAEPVGDGPGWDRESITELVTWLRSGRPIGPLGAGGYAGQVEALLDDRLATGQAPGAVVAAWAAEPAEATAQLEAAYRAMVEAQQRGDQARAEAAEATADRDATGRLNGNLLAKLAEVEAERDRYRQHSITLNSVLWRAAEALGEVPEGAEQIPHDPERVDRLIAELDRARAEIAQLRRRDGVLLIKPDEEELNTARRDGAADALEEAADDLAGPPPEVERSVLERLRTAAAELRSGEREIPRQDGGS